MSQAHIPQPWESAAERNGYPMPIIDEKKARQFAADRVYSLGKKRYTPQRPRK
jgi:deoxyribodipyrimidine photolyase